METNRESIDGRAVGSPDEVVAAGDFHVWPEGDIISMWHPGGFGRIDLPIEHRGLDTAGVPWA